MATAMVERRLAAILAADVADYSRLVQHDELGTLTVLQARREQIVEPLVASHHGRIFKLVGDGMLVEFASAVDAVQCAVLIQEAVAAANESLDPEHRMVLRIGVNIGDVIVQAGDLLGDGVNIAARLESLAEAGGICVSRAVFDQVNRKLDRRFEDQGLRPVKNIAEPLHVYRLLAKANEVLGASHRHRAPLPLPDKPSIAVLPFTDMSPHPEYDAFADGLTSDLITDLSRNAGLFVIARHSSFAYKGRSVDVRRIAISDLGVRYLLEGSARRAAGRVRINVQLIDALSGNHLWAERYDRGLEDIFAVQDEVTGKIVEAIGGRLGAPLGPRNRPSNLEAYDLCVRGRNLIADAAGSPPAVREASVLLRQAIALDPSYAEAHRWLAFNLWAAWAHCNEPEQSRRRESGELADKAIALDPDDAGSHWVRGLILTYERRWRESEREFTLALELDPSHAHAWAIRAEQATLSGNPKAGIEYVRRALRLNPHPAGWYYWELGLAQYAAGEYEAAVATLRKEATYRTGSRRILAAGLAQLGRQEEARREADLYLASNPLFSIARWAATQPFREKEALTRFIEGYRQAGLPE